MCLQWSKVYLHRPKRILRSGTSVGANYIAALRARSRVEFIAKLGVVLEEADETAYWIELIVESGLIKEQRLTDLAKEVDEICAIIFTTISTSRDGLKK